MNKFTNWLKSFVLAEDEPASNRKTDKNNSSVYINAHGYWAKIETNLPAERNAQVREAAHQIVNVVLSEGEV